MSKNHQWIQGSLPLPPLPPLAFDLASAFAGSGFTYTMQWWWVDLHDFDRFCLSKRSFFLFCVNHDDTPAALRFWKESGQIEVMDTPEANECLIVLVIFPATKWHFWSATVALLPQSSLTITGMWRLDESGNGRSTPEVQPGLEIHLGFNATVQLPNISIS